MEFDIVLVYNKNNLKIHQLLLNSIKTNCFIVQCENEGILVDPSDKSGMILSYLEKNSIKLKYMLATHGHFDHIFAAADIIASGIVDTLYVHERDFSEISKARTYSALIYKRDLNRPKIAMFSDELLDYLKSIGMAIEHAGGHTKGSCFLYACNKDFMITGDLALNHKLKITLVDRRENKEEFLLFINNVRKNFNPETVIFPGHGDVTNVSDELRSNKKWLSIREEFNGY